MLKKYFFLLLCCLSIDYTGNAQNSVAQLAKQIADKNPTDSLKVRAIFDWLTQNIAYDIEAYHAHKGVKFVSNEDLSQRGGQVFNARKAVCAGYAHLFYELGKLMGVPIEIVEGWGRTKNFYDNDSKMELHAWNAVKLKQRWYLLDATWASGGIDESGRFNFNKNEKYYLTPPQVFLREHYPHDPLWQLSDTPISFEAFRDEKTENPIFARFNVADTLARMESMDSLNKRFASFKRMLLIDPQNTTANHGLGFAYSQQAWAKMQQYSVISAKLQAVKTPAQQQAVALENKTKIFATLNEIEISLKASLQYFEKIQKSENFAANEQNIQASLKNLAQIKAERNRLTQYFVAIEKYRKK